MACLIGASCYGTGFTRAPEMRLDDGAASFGWPLFESVHADAWMVGGGGSCKDQLFWLVALFSFPVDVVLDFVLLPVDVAAGLAGHERNRVPSDL